MRYIQLENKVMALLANIQGPYFIL